MRPRAAAQERRTGEEEFQFQKVSPSDRIYVLDKGKVVESGTHEELMSVGEVYAGLWADADPNEG